MFEYYLVCTRYSFWQFYENSPLKYILKFSYYGTWSPKLYYCDNNCNILCTSPQTRDIQRL